MDRQEHSTGKSRGYRLERCAGAMRNYLSACEPGTAVAVEAAGNWYYWIASARNRASRIAAVVGASAQETKADDGGRRTRPTSWMRQGLNRLQRNETLPTVDSAGEVARFARTDSHAVSDGGGAHTIEKSAFSNASEMGTPASEYSDPCGKREPRRAGKIFGAIAGTDALGESTVAGTVGFYWYTRAAAGGSSTG